MPDAAYLLFGTLLGLACGWGISALRRKPEQVGAQLAEMETRLRELHARTAADMAERIEKAKSDSRLEIAERLQGGFSGLQTGLLEQLAKGREEQARRAEETAKRADQQLGAWASTTQQGLASFAEKQENVLRLSRTELATALGGVAEKTERKLEELRCAVETKLAQIQADNAGQLEQMRRTVDEKLQTTLEHRLTESFRVVSERLEQVHKGLGEMQSIANGVGDLKKVLTNVKTRGTWGEMQLGNLLAQMLAPDQFAANVATRPGSAERVEFAIRLPGKDDRIESPVWLPIDAKFPKEDYERLVEAADAADAPALECATAQLETRIRHEAKSIRDKYIESPYTTDFAILYLPIEGLYAEVLRRSGLVDSLQRDFRVTVAGPTVLSALLNSLQMGFRTLAIQKRSSEVWGVLAAVKTEFGRFGDVIGKVQKKLQEASNVIDTAATRTRAIERQLKDVQALPSLEAASAQPELLISSDGAGK